MKHLAISAALLVTAAVATEACDWVEVLEFHRSSQNAQITVSIDGKPQRDVKLVVSTPDGHPRLTLATDAQGIIRLPNLPAGKYCVAASVSPTLRADLCLDVSDRRGERPSSFSMNLAVKPPPPPTLEERLEAAEKAPIDVRTQTFAGIVEDPAGFGVSGTQVHVYKRGSAENARPLEFITNKDGHFAAELDPGTYTAVFQRAGFQIVLLIFEVAPDGDKEGLHVKLPIGTCTT